MQRGGLYIHSSIHTRAAWKESGSKLHEVLSYRCSLVKKLQNGNSALCQQCKRSAWASPKHDAFHAHLFCLHLPHLHPSFVALTRTTGPWLPCFSMLTSLKAERGDWWFLSLYQTAGTAKGPLASCASMLHCSRAPSHRTKGKDWLCW